MGQKVNPKSIRLLLTRDWDSKWFATKSFASNLVEDAKIRAYMTKKLGAQAAVDRIVIERKHQTIAITVFTGRPGVIIGRAGTGINELRLGLSKLLRKATGTQQEIKLLVSQIKVPELSAAFVAQNIGQQLIRRINFRRAAKQSIERTMQRGAKGIKVSVSGRLGGAEIARNEKFSDGKIPLSQFKANIDYAIYHAVTGFGVIGVKVWIYKGDMENGEGEA